ncbi:uncharacterized protein LOC128395955 [Panonychus citri]|uniref:uncharacterized protein LOC128395955 n=1 Tax=Panonychus citri TaxID=50023 RepID=UPI0023076E98|nr:uncharacterized protein LOC128395955 [Panonychus citri]
MTSEGKMSINIENVLRPMAKDECANLYNEWSDKYDSDMNVWQYDAPQGTATRFTELNLPKESKILDCGAGTGLLSHFLKPFGYTNIDALDGCEKMLEKAKQKDLYRNYFISFVGPDITLPMEEATYDAIVMCGIFTPGHFPIAYGTFVQLLRVIKKGGILSWGMTDPDHYADIDPDYANKNFQNILHQLTENKLIETVTGHPKELPSVQPKERFFYAVRKL